MTLCFFPLISSSVILADLHLTHALEDHFCFCGSWKFYKFWPNRMQNCFWISAMKCLITLSFFWKYCVNKFWQCAKRSEKRNFFIPSSFSPSDRREREKEKDPTIRLDRPFLHQKIISETAIPKFCLGRIILKVWDEENSTTVLEAQTTL